MSTWTGALLDGTYSATRHLALSLHGSADFQDVWMTMLTAYFDASRMEHKEGSAYAVAGFGSSVDEWLKFEGPWKKVLVQVGIPELHMADVAAKRKEEYRHLTSADYGLLMETLHALLQRHAAVSFARVIEREDVDRLTARGELPFVIAGVEVMRAVHDWRKRRSLRKQATQVVEDIIFDDGDEGKGALVDATPKDIAHPIFRDSRAVVQLQAADWLAWEMARLDLTHQKHRGHGGTKVVAVRGTLWAAARHFPRDWKYYYNGTWVDIFMDQGEASRLPGPLIP